MALGRVSPSPEQPMSTGLLFRSSCTVVASHLAILFPVIAAESSAEVERGQNAGRHGRWQGKEKEVVEGKVT
jgi:hypothetical protein